MPDRKDAVLRGGGDRAGLEPGGTISSLGGVFRPRRAAVRVRRSQASSAGRLSLDVLRMEAVLQKLNRGVLFLKMRPEFRQQQPHAVVGGIGRDAVLER